MSEKVIELWTEYLSIRQSSPKTTLNAHQENVLKALKKMEKHAGVVELISAIDDFDYSEYMKESQNEKSFIGMFCKTLRNPDQSKILVFIRNTINTDSTGVYWYVPEMSRSESASNEKAVLIIA